jgi:hypothetical protein
MTTLNTLKTISFSAIKATSNFPSMKEVNSFSQEYADAYANKDGAKIEELTARGNELKNCDITIDNLVSVATDNGNLTMKSTFFVLENDVVVEKTPEDFDIISLFAKEYSLTEGDSDYTMNLMANYHRQNKIIAIKKEFNELTGKTLSDNAAYYMAIGVCNISFNVMETLDNKINSYKKECFGKDLYISLKKQYTDWCTTETEYKRPWSGKQWKIVSDLFPRR